MSMNTPSNHASDILLIPISVLALVAVVSPVTIVRHMGGPRNRRAPAIELFLRVAGILVLLAAVIEWYRWWKPRTRRNPIQEPGASSGNSVSAPRCYFLHLYSYRFAWHTCRFAFSILRHPVLCLPPSQCSQPFFPYGNSLIGPVRDAAKTSA